MEVWPWRNCGGNFLESSPSNMWTPSRWNCELGSLSGSLALLSLLLWFRLEATVKKKQKNRVNKYCTTRKLANNLSQGIQRAIFNWKANVIYDCFGHSLFPALLSKCQWGVESNLGWHCFAYFALWLVQKTPNILSTNQMQNLNQTTSFSEYKLVTSYQRLFFQLGTWKAHLSNVSVVYL